MQQSSVDTPPVAPKKVTSQPLPSEHSELTLRLLELEFKTLQAAIDKFDDQRFKIKGWSITVAGALAALGINSANPTLIFAAAGSVLFFGFLELVFMRIQSDVFERSNLIEQLLEVARRGQPSAALEGYCFGVSQAFVNTFSWRGIPDVLKYRLQITVFHLGLFLSLLAMGIGVAL